MNSEKLVKLLPFLAVDGAIILATLLLVQLDWIVNHTLYNYGLIFSPDWATSYWTLVRIIFGLLGFTLVGIAAIGYVSYKKTREETARTVFICKSCGTALTRLVGSVSVKETLPKFKILKKCPLCDKKLLEK